MDPLQSAALLAGCCTIAGCGCSVVDPETLATFCYPSQQQIHSYSPLSRRRSLASIAIDKVLHFLGCFEAHRTTEAQIFPNGIRTSSDEPSIHIPHHLLSLSSMRRQSYRPKDSPSWASTRSTVDSASFQNPPKCSINTEQHKWVLPGASPLSSPSSSGSSKTFADVIMSPRLVARSQTSMITTLIKQPTSPVNTWSYPTQHDARGPCRQRTSPAMCAEEPELQSAFYMRRAYEHRRD